MPDDRKVALVTGGAKRVGRAIVERLSDAGFSVVFTYHSSEREANELANARNALPIRADLTEPGPAVESIWRAFSSFADRLDILVNSASAFLRARLADTKLPEIRQLNAIHVEAPLL